MYRTILVPVDGTDTSRNALRHAVSIASGSDATVHLLAVIEPSGNPLAFTADSVEEIDRELRELADAVAIVDESAAIDVSADVRRGDSPHETVLDFIDEIDADLVVLGRTGTRSLPQAVLGSTTDRIVRLSDVPVAVVPDTNG